MAYFYEKRATPAASPAALYGPDGTEVIVRAVFFS
jgi:hypothetical protein